MAGEFDEFILWVPEDERLVFHGRLLTMAQRSDIAGTTTEASIYEVEPGGYVVALAELLPEEIEADAQRRKQALTVRYKGSWPRGTVIYARRFPTLEAIGESDHDGFAVGAAGEALRAALQAARGGRDGQA